MMIRHCAQTWWPPAVKRTVILDHAKEPMLTFGKGQTKGGAQAATMAGARGGEPPLWFSR